MSRALLVVLDSLGIGAAPDAARFGDEGADTFGHILERCAPSLPHLRALGLHAAHARAHGREPCADAMPAPGATWAAMRERSTGKDTTSGHWEMCGLPVDFEWGYFTAERESFPQALLTAFCERAGLPGTLGNCRASGTTIIETLGVEHIATGKPIVYTSADSVFQIAAHETHFGLERLYESCRIARELLDDYRISRVIARPFVGEDPASFRRTGYRHDYAVPPAAPTLLDALTHAGRDVLAVGKVSDIFAGQGIGRAIPASGLDALIDATEATFADASDGSLTFVNLVDFDSEYGHRRDVAGYAAALERFDARLPALLRLARDGDLLLFTADHGNDPTWPGSDHTRECVPLLAVGGGLAPGDAGVRESFADLGQTLARHFDIPPLRHGTALPVSS
ncbi:MAG: phosphopentomutase [Lysobacter sp.]|nr:MAG: phosphopentomutase [Lysobacter sp.]